VPDCGLYIHDSEGQVIREVRVQVPERLDQPTLELLHRQCVAGTPALYARLQHKGRTRALFLHAQAVPTQAVITAARRRSPGRWLTGVVALGGAAGGRGVIGPEVFFRQVDIDPQRAWLTPLLLGMENRPATRQVRIAAPDQGADSGTGDSLWTWEVRGERFYYRQRGSRWWLYGAGNTPLLRLEQAVHLADPRTVDDYLWAVGAVRVGMPTRRARRG